VVQKLRTGLLQQLSWSPFFCGNQMSTRATVIWRFNWVRHVKCLTHMADSWCWLLTGWQLRAPSHSLFLMANYFPGSWLSPEWESVKNQIQAFSDLSWEVMQHYLYYVLPATKQTAKTSPGSRQGSIPHLSVGTMPKDVKAQMEEGRKESPESKLDLGSAQPALQL
jgi:hypothetical protein